MIKCLKSFLVVNLVEIFLECGIKDSSSILSIISKLIPTVRILSWIKILVNRYFGKKLYDSIVHFKGMDFVSTIVLFVSKIHFKRAMNRLFDARWEIFMATSQSEVCQKYLWLGFLRVVQTQVISIFDVGKGRIRHRKTEFQSRHIQSILSR